MVVSLSSVLPKAIILHTNRCSDEVDKVKKEGDSDDDEAGEDDKDDLSPFKGPAAKKRRFAFHVSLPRLMLLVVSSQFS